ncbi:MAG TPA: helix-turn-helix domain containing protein [Firmicutes bacterium]|nr:helix-turn-helix domain containing protein [Bacillota bacterium]
MIVSMLRFENIPRAAREAGVSESYARRVVRDFRERKLEALPPKHGGGRPRAVSEDQAKALADLVRTPPTVLNLPWTQWSPSKIHLYATKAGIIPKISLETLRTTLLRNEITYQRTKTWRMSNDPQSSPECKRATSSVPRTGWRFAWTNLAHWNCAPMRAGVGHHRNILTDCRPPSIDPTGHGISGCCTLAKVRSGRLVPENAS